MNYEPEKGASKSTRFLPYTFRDSLHHYSKFEIIPCIRACLLPGFPPVSLYQKSVLSHQVLRTMQVRIPLRLLLAQE